MAHSIQTRAQRQDWKFGANDKAEESLLTENPYKTERECDMIRTSNLTLIFLLT
jgi:hypothetical protein